MRDVPHWFQLPLRLIQDLVLTESFAHCIYPEALDTSRLIVSGDVSGKEELAASSFELHAADGLQRSDIYSLVNSPDFCSMLHEPKLNTFRQNPAFRLADQGLLTAARSLCFQRSLTRLRDSARHSGRLK